MTKGYNPLIKLAKLYDVKLITVLDMFATQKQITYI